MATNVPPPPDHPGAAMYQFTHGPGLHDIQPQRDGFWTLAGHDAEIFRLGFVHTPPGQTSVQLVYQVFRPIRNLDDLETHASELIYEYEGGKHAIHSNPQRDETKLRQETELASVPQHDEGFVTLPAARNDPVHLRHSDAESQLAASMGNTGTAMNQDQNTVQDGFQAEQGSVIQSDHAVISQTMSDPDAQVLSPVLDENLLTATQGIAGSNWAFSDNDLQAQDYNVADGTPAMNYGDLGMHHEQMIASEMPQTQEWAELPDANSNQFQGEDQMLLPNF
ncbi:hypothetical protein B0J13DRAFT_650555 [Dactylonectria estremocensis]|uniref:Uncharacterized protein n=1 Tax=Dactylonectria estremocensis TaxID=1079267 RepID=A0A9P9FBV6_9HYPO|nr:hypothetical protein B0J13DRAFT_650555 [Dactylonectria estremocensis]